MNSEQFKEYLLLYGSDLENWPDGLDQQAMALFQGSSEIRELVENEKGFESVLMDRSVDTPSSDFERRITLSAKPKTAREEGTFSFSTFFEFITLPKPALTMAFLLLFGFSLGFFHDTYADTGEDPVELSEYITFEEGEYYE